ncbi:IS66 family transposase [Bradyrhizobium sp. CCBAU 11386]|uniref:IS66 family transposase n=1 Tax=Bradyrhizobium sp. CCBAU 11386 TaxID=1630837 RepID=UPI003FA4AC60
MILSQYKRTIFGPRSETLELGQLSLFVHGTDGSCRRPTQRAAVRQSDTRQLIEDFMPWLEARLLEVSKKSGLGKAIRYTLNHWKGVTRFIDDGRIEIDSNTVERSIKPIGLGKKNYLFAGSEGAETWATLASLINSAKLHDIDPRH